MNTIEVVFQHKADSIASRAKSIQMTHVPRVGEALSFGGDDDDAMLVQNVTWLLDSEQVSVLVVYA
jgi:hypothetical protein